MTTLGFRGFAITTHVERFAPSPTGPLHLGHAYSALLAHDAARKAGGCFLLRIEDIDTTRSRPEFEAAILEDLAWLGIEWEQPVLRQSERFDAYRAVLDQFRERGLLYPCTCTRKQIAAAMSAPQEGSDTPPPYPGTCRGRSFADVSGDYALRLDMRKALASLGGAGVVKKLHFKETGRGPNREKGKIALDMPTLIETVGDIVLARKDIPASYHLSVVLDDAFQQITHVTRGHDLFATTPIHRVLQALTGRPTPLYHHHDLIRDDTGRRLAKRDDSRALSTLRAEGKTPENIRTMVGL